MPSRHESSARADYVPALCTHRPSLLPIEWLGEASGLAQEGWQRPPAPESWSNPNSVNHRVFERTLRPLVFRGACLSERHCCPSSPACVLVVVPPGSPGGTGPKGSGGTASGPRALTSDQVGIPAELKHINKRRKRNQPGLPQ
ncbi:hypothetical protein P175DRAFT_0512813 [Aspergillus ochraceoroseus IBT 24754]|uniref:Uncharacterized protein n=1 Tax=Aspergillus ochraceoroseus IBT 24754 TaxID=1392256 RepID=A0A2T5LKH3_9EURO|nr:hypothetical protein P175DRAFT_0512813 [Aspergillus ochraceoroseus IBT 24754]